MSSNDKLFSISTQHDLNIYQIDIQTWVNPYYKQIHEFTLFVNTELVILDHNTNKLHHLIITSDGDGRHFVNVTNGEVEPFTQIVHRICVDDTGAMADEDCPVALSRFVGHLVWSILDKIQNNREIKVGDKVRVSDKSWYTVQSEYTDKAEFTVETIQRDNLLPTIVLMSDLQEDGKYVYNKFFTSQLEKVGE